MKNRDASRQIKCGAIVSYIAIAFNILSGLIYTPWMLKCIGQSNYGLYSAAVAFVSYFTMDFGLGAAISRFISKYRAEGKEELKKLTGLPIVCLPYVAREYAGDDEKVFDAGPAEFVGLIKNAAYVLTDSFHATAFSVNLGVPFFSLLRFADSAKNGMNSRIYTILGELELQNRIIDEGDTITEDMLKMDFSRAHELLKQRRETDTEFLAKILER